MPRDIAGNYSLPPGINPVVPGTIIDVNWANPTLQDVASALTDSLSRSGAGGMLVPMRFADGTVAAPSISWVNEPTAGWYRAAANDFRYAILGADVLQLRPNLITSPSVLEVFATVAPPAAALTVRSTGSDQLLLRPKVAGGGAQIDAATVGGTDFEPLLLAGEHVSLFGRTGVNTIAEAFRAQALPLADSFLIAQADASAAELRSVGNALADFFTLRLTGDPVDIHGRTGAAFANALSLRVRAEAGQNAWLEVMPSAGGRTRLRAESSVVNATLLFQQKSGGSFRFANTIEEDYFQIASDGLLNPVNRAVVAAGAAGVGSMIRAVGDADSAIALLASNNGAVTIGSRDSGTGAGYPGLIVQGLVGTVNYLKVTGGVAGAAVVMQPEGVDANINLRIGAKGTSAVRLVAGFPLITNASDATRAMFNLPHGVAPAAPINGDLWTTTAGLFVRINGVTVGPLT